MKIVEINSGNFGSTGNIMKNIARATRFVGHDVYCFCAKSRSAKRNNDDKDIKFIGTIIGRRIHVWLSNFLYVNGCLSIIDTATFLIRVKKIKPDIIHMHNIHNCYINIPMLMRYIDKNEIKVVWTLHDCWSYTGHCAYYDLAGCRKWESECKKCSSLASYPATIVDDSYVNFRRKKKWFTSVELTLVTPSKWLSNEVGKSFLKHQNTLVINNGINLDVFRPCKSDFKIKYKCENKFILLGVAFGWGERKGLETFVRLAQQLNDKYQIVLVGTNEEDNKKLPDNIISIFKTENIQELVKIYSAADLFVNPTMEENFPTVNIEALACGTPVITYNTGGASEMVSSNTGLVVPRGDFRQLKIGIESVADKVVLFNRDDCVKQASQYSTNNMNEQYIELFELLNESQSLSPKYDFNTT